MKSELFESILDLKDSPRHIEGLANSHRSYVNPDRPVRKDGTPLRGAQYLLYIAEHPGCNKNDAVCAVHNFSEAPKYGDWDYHSHTSHQRKTTDYNCNTFGALHAHGFIRYGKNHSSMYITDAGIRYLKKGHLIPDDYNSGVAIDPVNNFGVQYDPDDPNDVQAANNIITGRNIPREMLLKQKRFNTNRSEIDFSDD